ncbi:hypothetical protein [Pedobacter antarcticus]|uniref:Uncharacterized protein n=2 Tax=Pedobacter antarcticus TaxID=34086 RepID=A0A081PCP7_9SPHI|nr:hypothetical protein [Pedobacter antarcticus]KEQ28470.1 hypothetical protein N180_02220 [Pedobacter antarcticus 4BY]SDL83114.1 hypothetical protein SAMN04488084_102601 [Pedobacter antarcticus]SFF03215.1 hypothetical protein SAMN03003324_02169 [Pedobacter antarcticus]
MENNENSAFQDALDPSELDAAANFSELNEENDTIDGENENEELSPADEEELAEGNPVPDQDEYTGYDSSEDTGNTAADLDLNLDDDDDTAIEPEDLDTLNAQDEDDQDTMS